MNNFLSSKYFNNFIGKLFLIFFLLSANGINAQKDYSLIRQELISTIDSYHRGFKLPGIAVEIITPGFSFLKITGKANIETGTDRAMEDKIRIGSITKTFVATVILQLADEGKINIDDKLEKYYPDYPNSSNISLRQILNMTSGIPDYTDDTLILKSLLYDRQKRYTPIDFYNLSKAMTPDFPPGEGWKYSNSNYIILGMLIEKITGNKIEDEISKRIIQPLELVNTSFPTENEITGQHSHGYMKDTITGEFIDVTVIDPSIPWAAGCMISNFTDLKIYAKALVNGNLISKKLQDERLKLTTTGKYKFIKYGLGINYFDGFLGHSGGITGYNTMMFYNPDLDVLFLVSINEFGKNGGKADRLFFTLVGIVYPEQDFFDNLN